jgi:hypothetical protein
MDSWIDVVGYGASFLIAASLLMSNLRYLRWINLAGAVVMAAYGALAQAWPVAAVNLFIAGIDAFYLARMSRQKDFFTLLPLSEAGALVRKFMAFHRANIARYAPAFDAEAIGGYEGFFVLRNLFPVGVFFYQIEPDRTVHIRLDYVIPQYRDRKNGDFLFRVLNERFGSEGMLRFRAETPSPRHAAYLRSEGFERDPARAGSWVKPII